MLWNITPAQLEEIERIAQDRSVDYKSLCLELYRCQVTELTIVQASDFMHFLSAM